MRVASTKYDSITADDSTSPFVPATESGSQSIESTFEYRRWLGVRRSTWYLVLYVMSYLAYLVLGGLTMAAIEGEHEENLRSEVRQLKSLFIERNPSVNSSDLEVFLDSVQRYKDRGISVLDRHKNNPNWGLGQSILFTVTVVTTIGYGHVTPLTSSGKVFCIVYSVLGIPFTLVFITAVVQRLLEPTCKFLSFFFARFGHHMSPFAIRCIHLLIMTVVFFLFFLVVPALLFSAIEDKWSFLDGLYFVFISLTTIGLGDYIPGDAEKQTWRDPYKISVAGFLLLGLVFMTLTATIFYDIPQLNFGTVLMQHKDIHVIDDTEESMSERTSLKESVKNLLTKGKEQSSE